MCYEGSTIEKCRMRTKIPLSEHLIKDMRPVVSKLNWGIGGLKNKFRQFLTQCPNRRNRFARLFEACARLTNFIHRRRFDFSSTLHGEIGEGGIHEGFVNDWA
jgi:hypothetical protein